MARTTFNASVRVEGLQETLRAFNRLPKDANTELRKQSLALAQSLADAARAAGTSDAAPQSRLVAPTVKARRDRVPAVAVGGTKRVGRNRVPVWRVLFGSEFGSNRFRQFQRSHSGRKGYWFFPTVEREGDQISKAWLKAADDIIESFTRDGV